MNRFTAIIAICLFVIVIPFVVVAQTLEQPKPCLEVVGTADYDFGTIEPSESVRHTFELLNNCKDTIHIASAQASCGCTAAILSEKDIAPGAKAQIDVKFHPPSGTPGKVSKTISVYLKDNPTPHTVLRISAKIATDIETDPAYVQLLGAVAGKEVSGKVSVKNVLTEDVELAEITSMMTAYADTTSSTNPSGANSVAIPVEGAKVTAKSKVIKPNESTEITISLVPKYQGQISGSISVKTKKGQRFIQVFGVVKPAETSIQSNIKNDAANKH